MFPLTNPYKSAKKKKKSEPRRASECPLIRQGSLTSTGSSANYPSSSAESPQVVNTPCLQNSVNNNDRKLSAEPVQKPGTKSSSHDKENEILLANAIAGENACIGTNLRDQPLPHDHNEEEMKDSNIDKAPGRRVSIAELLTGNQTATDSKKATGKRTNATKKRHEDEQGSKQRKLSDCWSTKGVSKTTFDTELVANKGSKDSEDEVQQTRNSVQESYEGIMATTVHDAAPDEHQVSKPNRADDCRTRPQGTSLQFFYDSSSDEDDNDEYEYERKPPALTQQFHQMTQEEHTSLVHQFTQRIRDSNDELVREWEMNQLGKAEDQEDDRDDDPIDLDLDDEALSKLRGFSQLEEEVVFARNEESSQTDTVYRYETPITDSKFGRLRTYRVGETWFYQPTPEHKVDPETVYTIVAFYVTGTLAKSAKCIVNTRMNKTFLGEDLRHCWVEHEGEPVIVPLRKLTQCLEGFSRPRYLWSENDGKTKGSEGYGFTYCHRVDGGCTKEEICEEPVVIELYAGVGGMSLGLQSVGFKVSYLVENDSNTARTLQGNFPDKQVHEEEVDIFLKRVNSKAPCYPNTAKHIHASTPCNGFSGANRMPNGGKNGLKNNSEVRNFVASVAKSKPVTVSFENVTGILKDKHLPFLQEAVATLFLELEYNVRVCVLNASDYGDAQNRRRVFLLASKKGIVLPKEPDKTHGEAPGLLKRKCVRDCIGDLEKILPEIGFGYVELDDKSIVGNHSSEGIDLKDEASRILLKGDDAAPTLYNQSTNAMAHYSQARALTIREMARLQSFPDKHTFPRSRNKARRQIYNAVPVGLAAAVAKSIMKSCYTRNYPHDNI